MAKILSVNRTEPGIVEIKGKRVATSIFKRAATGAVAVAATGLVGERRIAKGMCDDVDHALYFYPHEHYGSWQRELACAELPYGQFGENLTTLGLREDEVRVGDVLRCGALTVRVRQPRLPCAKLEARMGQRFVGRFLRSRRVGFFASVLVPGTIAAGDPIEVLERDASEPTIDELFRLTQLDSWDAVGLAALLGSRQLPPAWRELVQRKLELARDAEGWHGLRPLQVVERQLEAGDAVSLWLACPHGRPLAPFVAGQHVSVAWRGEAEAALRRAFILTSDPEQLDRYRITFWRVPGSSGHPVGVVSTALHDVIQLGDVLRVTAPRGHITLAEVAPDSRGVLFLSEGIGVASALPLLREWSRRRAQVPAVHLHLEPHHTRFALQDELARLDGGRLRRILAVRELGSADAPPGSELLLAGEPPASLLQQLAHRVDHVFIAGANQFTERVATLLGSCGATLHIERFGDLGLV